MADYYCFSAVDNIGGADIPVSMSGVTPSDSGTGGPTDPFLTQGKLQSVMVAGDRGFLAGLFYTADATAYFFTKTTASNIQLRQWPGAPQWRIKMSNKVGTASGWTNTAGVMTKTIAASLTISAFYYDYEKTANIDTTTIPGLSIHKSGIPIAASAVAAAAAVGTAKGAVFYEPTTGLITFAPPTGQTCSVAAGVMTSGANGLEYVVAGRSGISVLAVDATLNTGWVIDGAMIGPANGAGGAPGGCGVAVQNFQGTISNCAFSDTGVHGISCGASTKNTRLLNNTYSGCNSVGFYEVFNPGTGLTATGCRSINPLYGGWSPLAADGEFVTAGTNIGGIITHGDPASIVDVEVVNPRFVGYVTPAGVVCTQTTFDLADAPAPGSANNPETYGVRVRQTNPSILAVDNVPNWTDLGIVWNAAFINLRMNFTQFRNIGIFGCISVASATGGTILFVGCDARATISNPAGGTYLFETGANCQMILINCSGYDNSTQAQHSGAQAYGIFGYTNASASFTVIGGIFGFRDTAGSGTRGLCVGDSGAGFSAGAGHTFTDNLTFNIGTGLYSQNASLNTLAEWRSVVDANAVDTGATNPFSDITGATGLGLTAVEKTRKKLLTVHAAAGVNGVAYTGNYGAYQYPLGMSTSPTSISRSGPSGEFGRRNRRRAP